MKYTGIIFCTIVALASARIPSHWRNRLRSTEERIDPRFPQYIVDPLVPCPSNETYVHPRNCAWFYRCHHNIAANYYHRAYFECGHGTSFNQTMGHCTLHSDDNCKGIPYITTTPAPTTQNPVGLTGTTPTSSSTTEGLPPPSTESASSTEVIVPITDDPAVTCGECYDNNEICNDYTVCPSGGAQVALRLCQTSYKECPPCTERTRLCDEGMFYAPFEGVCYADPTTPAMKCSNTITCMRDGEIFVPKFVQDQHCDLVEGCTVANELVESTFMCRQFVQCYYDGSKPENDRWTAKYASCVNAGDVYSDALRKCVPGQSVVCPFYN